MLQAAMLPVASEAKADLNMPEPDLGVTPLIAAANAGHLDVCKYLMLSQHHGRFMKIHYDSWILRMEISPTIYNQPVTHLWLYHGLSITG
jgi:hypothetical protein